MALRLRGAIQYNTPVTTAIAIKISNFLRIEIEGLNQNSSMGVMYLKNQTYVTLA
jgi:hypothetical protein